MYPNSVVCYSTIPIISFKKTQDHYLACNDLLVPKYDDDDLAHMQSQLSNTLARINVNLTHQNRFTQYIPRFGEIKPCQLYWHQEIEKCVIRSSMSSRKVYKRIPNSALCDGVHPTYRVEQIWYRALHNNFTKMAVQLLNSYDLTVEQYLK